MERRKFITRSAARPQRVNTPRIGFLGLDGESSGVDALRAGLRDLGPSKASTSSSSGDGQKRSTNYLNSQVSSPLSAGDLDRCDCFVVDQKMPAMSGLDLIAQLRDLGLYRACDPDYEPPQCIAP